LLDLGRLFDRCLLAVTFFRDDRRIDPVDIELFERSTGSQGVPGLVHEFKTDRYSTVKQQKEYICDLFAGIGQIIYKV
jgi:hypothetical protein